MTERPLIARLPRWPLIPLGVYALSRLVSTLVFLGLQSRQTTDPSFLAGGRVPIQVQPPTYLHIITNWDGQWYRLIAEQGYPSTLPMTGGQVWQNQWAFYPGFPMLCRVLMRLGMSYEVAASVVTLTAAAIGCCLLYALVRTAGSRFTATMAVVGFAFFPAATVLQAAYSESLAFVFIVGALLALNRRRYGWFIGCVLVLSLVRPVALPMAVVVGLHTFLRWRRREVDPFPRQDRVWAGAAIVAAVGSAGVWPLIAAVATGRLNAFYETQQTWADNGQWSTWLSETVGLDGHVGGQGVMLFTVIAAFGIVAIVTQRAARAWPTELRTWGAAYVLYLLATTRVTPSITRYLMLAIVPWWPVPEVSERRLPAWAKAAILAVVIGAAILLQIGWTGSNFIVGPDYRGYP